MKEIRDLYPPDRHGSGRRSPADIAIILLIVGVLALGLFEALATLLRPEASLLFRPGGLRELALLIVGVGVGALLARAIAWLVRGWASGARRRRRASRPPRISTQLRAPTQSAVAQPSEPVGAPRQAPVRPQSSPVQPLPDSAPSRPQVEIVVRSRKLPTRPDNDQPTQRRIA